MYFKKLNQALFTVPTAKQLSQLPQLIAHVVPSLNLTRIAKQIRDDRPQERQHSRLFVVLQFDLVRLF